MLSDDKITDFFCMEDVFCKFFNETVYSQKGLALEQNQPFFRRNPMRRKTCEASPIPGIHPLTSVITF